MDVPESCGTVASGTWMGVGNPRSGRLWRQKLNAWGAPNRYTPFTRGRGQRHPRAGRRPLPSFRARAGTEPRSRSGVLGSSPPHYRTQRQDSLSRHGYRQLQRTEGTGRARLMRQPERRAGASSPRGAKVGRPRRSSRNRDLPLYRKGMPALRFTVRMRLESR